mmetsp:Transcript_53123/g.128992  ORF Transcript_53123/g.128992 Transcript_53123/m.128992 type:complete len:796 (+) Transcript_53123:58-2445(+)
MASTSSTPMLPSESTTTATTTTTSCCTSSLGGLREMMKLDKYRLEVLARVGLMLIIGLALSTASIPQLVPPSSSYMIGIFVCSLSLSLPKFMMALTSAFPLLLGFMILALLVSSMLLSCINVSVNFMTIIYSLLTLVFTGFFFGETYASLSSVSSLLIAIPGMLVVSFVPLITDGGLTVSDLWKASGTENALAVFRNFLICICWALMAIMAGIIFPPFRTVRKMLSSTIIPQGILALVKAIENDNEMTETQVYEFRTTMEHLTSSLKGKAKMTAFEPRIWRNENLVKPLDELMDEVGKLAECVLLKHSDSVPGGESYIPTIDILRLCATALRTNSPSDFASLSACALDKVENTEANDNDMSYLTDITFHMACKVQTATLQWLEALNGSGGAPENAKEAIENDLKNNCAWIFLPLIPFPRIAKVVMVPFQPSKWNAMTFIWSLEYTIGYVALFCLSIYVPGWRDLGIGGDNSLYSGWHLLGYAFAWMPTVEGTAKKAFARAFGTALGGFMAWVGVIVCSWSYDDDAPMSPYGTVAYITVFTLISTLYGIDSGPAAMFGSNHDHGFPAMYFSLTMSLIMLEVYAGSGDKSTLTVNRIVATISGVLMAVIVQIIPPHIMGTDLCHTEKYYDSIKDTLIAIIEQMTKDDPQHDYKQERELVANARMAGQYAMFLLKDADTIQCLPLFKVQKNHRSLLESMNVTCTFMDRLIDFITKNENSTAVFADQLPFFLGLLADLKDETKSTSPIPGTDDQHLPARPSVAIEKDQTPLILKSSTELLTARVKKHSEMIRSMKEQRR